MKKQDVFIEREANRESMKLPDFATEEEERAFWNKQSISDYWEDLIDTDDTFKRPKLTPVTLKFDPLLLIASE